MYNNIKLIITSYTYYTVLPYCYPNLLYTAAIKPNLIHLCLSLQPYDVRCSSLTPATSHTSSTPPPISTKDAIDTLEVHRFRHRCPPLLPSVKTSSPNPIPPPRSTTDRSRRPAVSSSSATGFPTTEGATMGPSKASMAMYNLKDAYSLWDILNTSPVWQDRIFHALAALYGNGRHSALHIASSNGRIEIISMVLDD
ncbi:unnamed protein product [Lactuca virosa]|uniref:Uncharacterized protein n=1 Tax=Lactuca virosa TaxID=75947 RepID=A0AAU9N4Y5_9ASTR|nr:unnamed protein product [Lactuca virosa]